MAVKSLSKHLSEGTWRGDRHAIKKGLPLLPAPEWLSPEAAEIYNNFKRWDNDTLLSASHSYQLAMYCHLAALTAASAGDVTASQASELRHLWSSLNLDAVGIQKDGSKEKDTEGFARFR